MKKGLCTMIILLAFLSSNTQDIWYDITSVHAIPIKVEALENANKLIDVNPGYPSNWISTDAYISSKVSATCEGKYIEAMGDNDILNTKQKLLFSKADIGTEIEIEIHFNQKNIIHKDITERKMQFAVTVIPDVQASFPGGELIMKNFIKEHAIDEIAGMEIAKLVHAEVKFFVNEAGEAYNARIVTSSEDKRIDALLLKTIEKMPKWKPAEIANGKKVVQELQLNVGIKGC